ncbi:MAG: DUF2520 domain-containing protein [Bacteroidaceae bacterium]
MKEIRKIVCIGAGNMATNLTIALQQANIEILQVYSRTECSASQLATSLNCSYTTDLQNLSRDADLYLISLPDDIVIQLASTFGNIVPDAIMVHTGGSLGLDTLTQYREKAGVFYPMQTVQKNSPISFHKVPLFVEGNDKETTAILYQLASKISDTCYQVSSEQRKGLHLSAVFANNFTNEMLAISFELLEKYDLPYEVMIPLIKETLNKALTNKDPRSNQTGPAKRVDLKVIDDHIEMLHEDLIKQQVYKTVTEAIKESQKNYLKTQNNNI